MAIWLLTLLASTVVCMADDFGARCDDRAAIERVYHSHRLGTKQPFEQVLPREAIERMVRTDMRKEEVLRNVYRVEVTDAMVDSEVQRIRTTTRAPDVLAEIRTALGDSPARFARSLARPLVVDRMLRQRFENDDSLHAGRRTEAERVRNDLLTARKAGAGIHALLPILRRGHTNEVTEITWQLTPRPGEISSAQNPDEAEVRKRFGPQAKILSSPNAPGGERKLYFDDLPPDLQHVLKVQLRQPGDVSAVIEMAGGFLVYLVRDRTPETLGVAALTLPKRSYEHWLEQQK